MNKRIRAYKKILSLRKEIKNVTFKDIKKFITYGRKY